MHGLVPAYLGVKRENRRFHWNVAHVAGIAALLLGLFFTCTTRAASDRIVTASLFDIVPKSSTQRIAVIGDSLAQDLWNGLHKLYRDQENVEFIKFTKVSSGLVRDDVYDWNAKVRTFVKKHDFDIAIVLIGGNDRQAIRAGGKRHARFGKGWNKEYAARVTDFTNSLKQKSNMIYWLGLPIVKSGRMSRDYTKINKIYKAQAKANGITFVNTWTLFDTEDGKFTSFGLDVKGVKRRLRKDDGFHFTVAGKKRFALEIVTIINRHLNAKQSGPVQLPGLTKSDG